MYLDYDDDVNLNVNDIHVSFILFCMIKYLIWVIDLVMGNNHACHTQSFDAMFKTLKPWVMRHFKF